jgi:hypothetical protein
MKAFSHSYHEDQGEKTQSVLPQTLKPYWPEEAVSINEAAFLAKKSVGTMRNWAANDFLGRPVGPVSWQVSRVALAMYLDGNRRALAQYLRGDRSSPTIVAYYERLGLGHLVKARA